VYWFSARLSGEKNATSSSSGWCLCSAQCSLCAASARAIAKVPTVSMLAAMIGTDGRRSGA
jgi:hypothetical protein